MIYEKATAEVILFDNSDVIRTSGSCKNKGQDNGNGCKKTSGQCPGNQWGENGNSLNEWRANRAGL